MPSSSGVAEPRISAAPSQSITGRRPGSDLAPFVGVEREVEGEPVVALLGGLARLRERFDRRVVLVGGVLIGPRRPGRVDDALCLVHLPAGRIFATGDEQRARNEQAPRAEAPNDRHWLKYTGGV